jgi:hypothetical protein
LVGHFFGKRKCLVRLSNLNVYILYNKSFCCNSCVIVNKLLTILIFY